MRRWRSVGLLLAGLLVWTGRADGRPAIDPAQDVRLPQDTTPIFVCGEDERIPPIPLDWTNAVLAGDGRLYSPCPGVSHGLDHREIREAVVLGMGRYSGDAELRWRAAQAMARNATRPVTFSDMFGRYPPRVGLEERLAQVDGLGGLVTSVIVSSACSAEAQLFGDPITPRRWQPGRLFDMFRETTAFAVRGGDPPRTSPAEFAVGRRWVAREGEAAIGVLLSRPGLDANVVTAATRELRGCYIGLNLGVLPDNELAGLVLEDLGLAHYRDDDQVTETENFLMQESRGTLRILGAVKGLEALFRQHPQHEVGENARLRLRELVTFGDRRNEPLPLDTDARIRRLALMALQNARDRDPATLRQAVTDADWQVRRLAAASLNLAEPQMAALGDLLARDAAFQVRYELLSPLARLAAQTHDCAPVIARLDDSSPLVVMRAMDLLAPTCTDLDEVIKTLAEQAGRLGNVADDKDWHINSRAFTTLARLKPAVARPLMEGAVKSAVWQVRAAAAAAGAGLGDEASALALVRDPEPNVQTAALDALSRMRSAATVPRAIDVLKNAGDYQLLRMAASVLRALPADAKDDASNALLMALRRLTAEETDTSRDPRVAILDRLAETLNPRRVSDLLSFVGDYDEAVNAAAVNAYVAIMQTAPAAGPKRARYPFQPSASALRALPSQATIQLEEGMVTLQLLPDAAPVTVARFAALVAQGYYNGLTFHRIVPNFVVQGGSPGANEYSGAARYMRDEVGPQAVHVRGAVGMSTRGDDTGDGQIFIDLIDLPRLDRDYTVFAYVTQGMPLVDRLLEGAKIVSVSVR